MWIIQTPKETNHEKKKTFSLVFDIEVEKSCLFNVKLKFIITGVFLWILRSFRSSRLEVLCRKGVLRNFTKFTRKHLCHSLFFNKVAVLQPATLFKKETLAQVFSCEFCEISKNIFFYRTAPVAASEVFKNSFFIEHLRWLFCIFLKSN